MKWRTMNQQSRQNSCLEYSMANSRKSYDDKAVYTYCKRDGLQHCPPLGVPQTGPKCSLNISSAYLRCRQQEKALRTRLAGFSCPYSEQINNSTDHRHPWRGLVGILNCSSRKQRCILWRIEFLGRKEDDRRNQNMKRGTIGVPSVSQISVNLP